MHTEKPFHHRAGLLKQSNKAFKSKHATKGAIKDKIKGLVFRKKFFSFNIFNIFNIFEI